MFRAVNLDKYYGGHAGFNTWSYRGLWLELSGISVLLVLYEEAIR